MRQRVLQPIIALAISACSNASAPVADAPAHVTPAAATVALGAAPLAVDARGLPRLLVANGAAPRPATTASASAIAHVAAFAPAWGVRAMPELASLGEVRVPGGTIVRVQQTIARLPVHRGELRVLVGPGGTLLAASGTLVDAGAGAVPAFVDDETGAIARAVTATHGAGVTVERARARKMWHRSSGTLVAAWVVEAYTSRVDSTDGDAWRTVIAADGRVLARENLEADAAFDYRVFAEPTGDLRPLDGPIADVSPHPTGTPDGSYPAYVAPSLVRVEGLNAAPGGGTDAWLPANATETIGNNVEAYADISAPSGLTFGDFRATTTAERAFDRIYDTASAPLASQAQQMASITSLFFVINWLHDFWYDAGFTEAAGNAQNDNYGRGGEDRDALLAEAQDNALGGSRNNANMATPSDGMPPRMQIYLWTGQEDRTLTLAPAAGMSRTVETAAAGFGPQNFDASGTILRANDGTGVDPRDACEPLAAGSATGRIVLATRGNCTFETKVLNAQNAGAAGVLITNHTAAQPPPRMGDDVAIQPLLTIGALSITLEEGAAIDAELATGPVTATLHRLIGTELDGSVDATLIAHELGHYLHHRLSVCTTTWCRAMSEGWADFVALLLMARAGDDLDGAYPFSVYATQGITSDPAYFGIRRAPYSTNPAINALSFRHMADGEPTPTTHPFRDLGENSQVHNAGEVWAAVLWEAYVALQKAGGDFEAVRAQMASYVVAGLLLAPPDVTPLEMRDALLAAVRAASVEDHDIVAAAFARRGFGTCATGPGPDSNDFVGIVESVEVRGRLRAEGVTATPTTSCDDDALLDAGETARVVVRVANLGHAALTDIVPELRGMPAGLTLVAPPAPIARLEPNATAEVTLDLALADDAVEPLAGNLELAFTAANGCEATTTVPLSLRMNVDDVEGGAAVDTFDSGLTVWTVTGDPAPAWIRVRETALDGIWRGAALGARTDTALLSPVVTVGTGPLVIRFQHRFAFDSTRDGGVLEYTSDGGATWRDVSAIAPMPYPGAIDADAPSPLAGRFAFTGQNAAYPAFDAVTLDLGSSLAGKQVQLRYRVATGSTVASLGWEIDDVALDGISGAPFPQQVADAASCDPDPPQLLDQGGCCDAGGLTVTHAGTAFGVLVLLLRRRRRSEKLAVRRAP